MLSVVMPSVFMLNVVVLSIVVNTEPITPVWVAAVSQRKKQEDPMFAPQQKELFCKL
jgi:hypothetical protein